MLNKIHHIAFAVYDLKKTIEDLKVYGISPLKKVMIRDRKMEAALFKVGQTWLEYLTPVSEDSPLTIFLQEQGEGFHHIAYQVSCIEELRANLPEDALLSSRISNVGDWSIADIEPKYSLGINMQIIEENQ
ncbi:hypothetical protein ES708_14831 [subsurface metagenome]